MQGSAAGADALRKIVDDLQRSLGPHDGAPKGEVIETHISVLLLAGRYAYKFKKPVNFGFLDFSTLEQRRHFCEREVELNRRAAPDLYCGVIKVVRGASGAEFSETGSPIEYAVKMRRFEATAILDRRLADGLLGRRSIRALADSVAHLHTLAPRAEDGSPYGSPSMVAAQLTGAFETLRDGAALGGIEVLAGECVDRSVTTIAARQRCGAVRQCHGDLHLSNVLMLDGHFIPFDCIEFSDELSWIDTCSDIAFLVMDLDVRGEPGLANVFLNRYLEITGDYAALALLRLYTTYRTLIRAKVALLAVTQEGAAAQVRCQRHLDLAVRYLGTPVPGPLIITHGLSGSGKSYVSELLAGQNGYLHIRSDLERRRLAGLAADARTEGALGDGIYDADYTAQTYDALLAAATYALRAGFGVIIDATFLHQQRRQMFQALSQSLGASFYILDCAAPLTQLRERITTRQQHATDPSEATLDVLERQLQMREPLTDEEAASAIAISPGNIDELLASKLADLGASRMMTEFP